MKKEDLKNKALVKPYEDVKVYAFNEEKLIEYEAQTIIEHEQNQWLDYPANKPKNQNYIVRIDLGEGKVREVICGYYEVWLGGVTNVVAFCPIPKYGGSVE